MSGDREAFEDWHSRNYDTLPGTELHRVERQGMQKAWIAATALASERQQQAEPVEVLDSDNLLGNGWQLYSQFQPRAEPAAFSMKCAGCGKVTDGKHAWPCPECGSDSCYINSAPPAVQAEPVESVVGPFNSAEELIAALPPAVQQAEPVASMKRDLEKFRDVDNTECGRDWFISRVAWHLDRAAPVQQRAPVAWMALCDGVAIQTAINKEPLDDIARTHMWEVVPLYAAPVQQQAEPVAWMIPGNDNARPDGSLDAMAWQEGEFSMPVYCHAQAKPRFDKTYCSQCGGEFGPGDHGLSHCSDHAPPVQQSEPAPGYCKHCKQYTIEAPLPVQQSELKRCEACRETGLLHCSDPENCGGPWDKHNDAPVDPAKRERVEKLCAALLSKRVRGYRKESADIGYMQDKECEEAAALLREAYQL